jgi:glycerophosphoryl diester phosphodiesterase
MLIGHRGARGLFPENTLEGFARTLALGVCALEFDVGLTADGVPVVLHDPRPNPDLGRLDGQWPTAPGPPVHRTSFADLAAYDIGRARPNGRVASLFPDQAPIDGARIPSLASVIAATGGAELWIELKSIPSAIAPDATAGAEALTDAALDVIERGGAAGRVVVQSFDWRCLRRARARLPALRLSFLTRDADRADRQEWFGRTETDGAAWQSVLAEGGAIWAPEYVDLSAATVAAARAAGLSVAAWTVNATNDMRRLVDWGVDWIITDYPDRGIAAGLA